MIFGKTKLIILLLFTIIAIAVFAGYMLLTAKKDESPKITSFEECVSAGYPVMESYPEQCQTPDGKSFTREIPKAWIPEDTSQYIASKRDMITVETPVPMSIISSPFTFRGQARGNWFFEADFPVVLVNWDGLIIAETYASAVLDPADPDATWMTEEFVSFEGTIEFSDPSWEDDFSKTGTLIFQKDNPSGLPENDDALEIPVLFAPIER